MAALPKLRLSTSVEEKEVVKTLQPGQEQFLNEDVREEYATRLQAIHDEMVVIPGLREVTKMALERAAFLYCKMRDLEKSGALDPSRSSQMKVMFGLYEKILSGWVKVNEELYKAARQIDVEAAFKQSFISQVSAILRKHLEDQPELMQKLSADLVLLS